MRHERSATRWLTICASVVGSGSRCPRTADCWKGSWSSSSGRALSGSPPTLALEWARYAGGRAPALLAPASVGRARVRAPSRDDRPRKRGSLQGPVAWPSPADRAIHIHREGDRGADRGRRETPSAVARGATPDTDRALGGHRDAPRGDARARPSRCRSASRRGACPRRQAEETARGAAAPQHGPGAARLCAAA